MKIDYIAIEQQIAMNSTCNVAHFENWYNEPYDNELSKSLLVLYSTQREDKEIWDVMNFNSREKFFSGDLITNGQVMEGEN